MPEVKDPSIKLFGKTIQLSHLDHSKGDDEQQQYYSGEIKKTMENEHEDDSSSSQSTSLRINNNNPKTPTYDIQIPSRTTQMNDKILSCPRCSSIDTKFSYYNNYNVNQPRHLCKNCQRYWTEGGTKRNTPIGSGRRKNKSLSLKFSYKSQKSKDDSMNLVENGGNYGLMNVPKYPVQIPCFPSHPWCYSWNSVCYRPPVNLYNSGFRMNFYPIPGYRGCSLQVQRNPLSMLMPMPLMNPNCPLQDKDSETSRVNDSSKAEKDSIWSPLGMPKDENGCP